MFIDVECAASPGGLAQALSCTTPGVPGSILALVRFFSVEKHELQRLTLFLVESARLRGE